MAMVMTMVIACVTLVWTTFFTMACVMTGVIHFELTMVRIVHVSPCLDENSDYGNDPCHICAGAIPYGQKF